MPEVFLVQAAAAECVCKIEIGCDELHVVREEEFPIEVYTEPADMGLRGEYSPCSIPVVECD